MGREEDRIEGDGRGEWNGGEGNLRKDERFYAKGRGEKGKG